MSAGNAGSDDVETTVGGSDAGSDLERLPARLSPSRAQDFATCPRLFYYKTILGMSSPPTMATLRGNLAHEAFERIFDHPADERNPDVAVPYVSAAWERMIEPDLDAVEGRDRERAARTAEEALLVAPRGSDSETELLETSREMVRKWFLMERVTNFSPTEVALPSGETIDGREVHVSAQLGDLTLHGYVDRLDQWQDSSGSARHAVTDYKGLALDTPVPTPSGWTTMGFLSVGDQVVGTQGEPVTVTQKSGVHNRPCFAVTWGDGETIVADNVHLWSVLVDGNGPVVLSTEELAVLVDGGHDVRVVTPQPLKCAEWSDESAALFAGRQWACGARLDVRWLRASVEERRAVLLGYMQAAGWKWDDNGGTGWAKSGHVLNLWDLVGSLGGVTRAEEERYGEQHLHVCVSEEGTVTRRVVSVLPTASVPTQCIQVDAPDSLYLAGRTWVVTHNTGKVPRPQYEDKYWMQLRIYALLAEHMWGVVPDMLRLVFVATGDRERGILTEQVTEAKLRQTKGRVLRLWDQIQRSAKTGKWEPKKGPLCNWCHFQSICPAWNSELGDRPVDAS